MRFLGGVSKVGPLTNQLIKSFMMLFFIGIIEMLIVTFWTKAVTNTQVAMSGAITVVNVMIWYYVIKQIVDNVDNWYLALLYAFGCAIGTVITTAYFRHAEGKAQNAE